MLTIFSNKKTEIYNAIKEELQKDEDFKNDIFDCYIDEMEDLGLYSENVDNKSVTNALLKLVKADVRACFEDCYNSKKYLRNSSKYRGSVRLSDHFKMSSAPNNSAQSICINIIWE